MGYMMSHDGLAPKGFFDGTSFTESFDYIEQSFDSNTGIHIKVGNITKEK